MKKNIPNGELYTGIHSVRAISLETQGQVQLEIGVFLPKHPDQGIILRMPVGSVVEYQSRIPRDYPYMFNLYAKEVLVE